MSVARTTVEPFDEPTTQKPPALRGCARGGRPLRCAARPMSPHRSSRRAWRIASPADNVDGSIGEERALIDAPPSLVSVKR